MNCDRRLGGVRAPSIACGTSLVGLRARPSGSSRSVSVTSLCGPGRLIASRRSWTTGTARSATGRSLRRKGARSLVAGLASLTTGVRSSSVARRLTNVVFAWRRVGGNGDERAVERLFWLAIAPSAWFAFAVRAARSLLARGDRAQRPRALDEELAEAPLVAGQLGEQAPGRRQRRARSTCRCCGRPACAVVDGAEPWITFWSALRVSAAGRCRRAGRGRRGRSCCSPFERRPVGERRRVVRPRA